MMTLLTVLSLIASQSSAAEKTFVVDDPGGRNMVKFESKAPLEQVIGTSSKITGTISFDPQEVIKTAKGDLVVDLTSLKTGISLRDEHLQSADYLNVVQYPKATLTILSVESDDRKSINPGQTVPVTAKGQLNLHGVEKEVTITGTVSYLSEIPEMVKMGYPGDLLNVDASFKINLSDFCIQRPQFLMLKLSEEIIVSVNFTATTGRAKN